MNEQDIRAVEGLARCGISLEGLLEVFPRFPADEIREIYGELHGRVEADVELGAIKMNCS